MLPTFVIAFQCASVCVVVGGGPRKMAHFGELEGGVEIEGQLGGSVG